MISKSNYTRAFSALSALLLGGMVACSHAPISDTERQSERDEISRLDQDLNAGLENQYDVLAGSDFKKAQSALEKAKREEASGSSHKTVLKEVASARSSLNRAKAKSEAVHDRASTILEARTQALDAGVRNQPRLAKDLGKQDDDLRAEIDDLEKNRTTPARQSDLQHGYQRLELLAIQGAKLGHARAEIDAAIKNNAKKYTPMALKQAEIDYRNAENIIQSDRHNDAVTGPAVDKANYSAHLLTDVLAQAKHPGGVITEEAALDLVRMNRKAQGLEEKLGQATAETNAQTQQINRQGAQLKAQGAILSLDQALESARKEFNSDEADVYRQGDKLLIRLKKMNFASGRADLPASALPVLAKVKTIAEELNPQEVIVQGHTDSTGNPAKNLTLSKSRAEAVASYFENNGMQDKKVEAIGYGIEKPLTTNKTASGRAQNRRVDVLITPSASSNQ